MTLSNPAAPVRPWLDYKSYGSRQPTSLPSGPTKHYEERLLHLFLTGVSTFYYFNPATGLIGGTRATGADHQLLSTLLSELDQLIGCQDRQWLRDSQFRWLDSFFLTGMTAGNSTVWRLSFEAEPAPTVVSHPTGVTVPGLQFDLGAPRGLADCELRFPGAQVANISRSPASQGMWLVQPTAIGAVEGKLCRVVCGGVSRGWPLHVQG